MAQLLLYHKISIDTCFYYCPLHYLRIYFVSHWPQQFLLIPNWHYPLVQLIHLGQDRIH